MKPLRLLIVLFLILFVSAIAVHATCVGGDVGTAGNDTIDCTVTNPPAAADVQGQDGNDTITIESGVTVGNDVSGGNIVASPESGNDTIVNNGIVNASIIGDSVFGDGSGNNVIINNGNSLAVYGNSYSGDGSGNDMIVNNGTVGNITGDSAFGNGSGNDMIVNNGTVVASMVGDTLAGVGSGNDVVINNGTVSQNMYGDDTVSTGTGDDILINNGSVAGTMRGDGGNDTFINNGVVGGNILADAGSDTVIIQGNTSIVGGIIDGGTGYDVLTFALSSTNPAQMQEWADQIYAANPSGGTISFNGHTYTWTNFEELTQLLFTLAPLNPYGSPFAVYCHFGGGIDVYAVSGQQGSFAFNVSAQVISNGKEQAANGNTSILSSSNITLYALTTGELQVNASNGTAFTFRYEAYCGILPEAQSGEVVEVEEVLPAFTIINQPYGG